MTTTETTTKRRETGILFKASMMRALLAGEKTETRRVLKVQPLDILPMNVPAQWVTLMTRDPNHGTVIRCRYGQPGDLFYSRETFRETEPYGSVYYRADEEYAEAGEWRPSIFQPKRLARFWGELTAVRVERVQAITEAGAVAEGMAHLAAYYGLGDLAPRRVYADLWQQINGKIGPNSWDANPWVWVLTFKKGSRP